MDVCPGCAQPVRWVTTEHGRPLPLDPDPHPDGTVVPVVVGGQPRAHILTGPELPALGPAWRPHQCPPPPRRDCTVCRGPLDPHLVAAQGDTTHPTCDPGPTAARTRWLAARARDAAAAGRKSR